MRGKQTSDPVDVLPRVGVGAVVFDQQGRILLVKRNSPPKLGYWTVPGGKQESKETLVQACTREVLEETGLSITVGPVVAVVERIQGIFHYVIIDFLASLADHSENAPRHGGDVSDARWMDLDRLGDYALVEGLEAILRNSKTLSLTKRPGGLTDPNGNQSDFIASPGFPNPGPR